MSAPETKTIATKTRPSWEKALSFARAAGSVVTNLGLADQATRARRLESCRSCEKIDRAPDGQEYCGECDCGRWELSRLDAKLAFPYLECPLGRAGFSNEGQVSGAGPIERTKCTGCAKPEPDRTRIPVGALVVIVAKMPGEALDVRAWTVESSRPDQAEPQVYDIRRRRRFFSWDFWRNLGKPERAMVSRDAIARFTGAGVAVT